MWVVHVQLQTLFQLVVKHEACHCYHMRKKKIADLVPQLFQLKNSFALMMNSPTQENCTILLLKIGHL